MVAVPWPRWTKKPPKPSPATKHPVQLRRFRLAPGNRGQSLFALQICTIVALSSVKTVDNFLFGVIAIFSFLSPPLLLPWAWVRWTRSEVRFPDPLWRGIAGLSCLVLVSLQILACVFVFFSLSVKGDFSRGADVWLSWSHLMRGFSVFVILLCLLGKGRGRILAMFSSIAVFTACILIFELR